MDGRTKPEWMSEEEFAEVQRVYEINKNAADDELWRMACLTVGKKDHELLGETEFQLRDLVLRIGARTLEAAVNDRRKKGAT